MNHSDLMTEVRKLARKSDNELISMAGRRRLRRLRQDALATNTSWRIRQALAANPHIAPEVQALLADDTAERIVNTLLEHDTLHPDVLRALFGNASVSINTELATRSDLPLDIQLLLSRNTHGYAVRSLAKNLYIDDQTHAALIANISNKRSKDYQDTGEEVLTSLLENPTVTAARKASIDMSVLNAYPSGRHYVARTLKTANADPTAVKSLSDFSGTLADYHLVLAELA